MALVRPGNDDGMSTDSGIVLKLRGDASQRGPGCVSAVVPPARPLRHSYSSAIKGPECELTLSMASPLHRGRLHNRLLSSQKQLQLSH